MLALLLAGCAAAPDADEQWYLGGAWTSEYTQADLDAWCVIAKEYDNECTMMESFPPQFGLRFATQARCEEARAKIVTIPHTTARGCTGP